MNSKKNLNQYSKTKVKSKNQPLAQSFSQLIPEDLMKLSFLLNWGKHDMNGQALEAARRHRIHQILQEKNHLKDNIVEPVRTTERS